MPVWLPVAVPWAGAALLAALPRRPVLARAAVSAASLAAALALVFAGGAARPDALASALLLAGAVSALLAALGEAGTLAPGRGEGRFSAAGLPLLQGAQALALLAADSAAVAWIGLAVGAGAGVALVALSGGRRAFAAAWRMLLLCGAGLALSLLGVALLGARGAAVTAGGLPGLGFVLLLLGYGALAGLAPMNAWLPRAVAVAPPPVAAALAGLLLPTALHAVLRAAGAVGPAASGVLPPAALLVAGGLATALAAAFAAWNGAGPHLWLLALGAFTGRALLLPALLPLATGRVGSDGLRRAAGEASPVPAAASLLAGGGLAVLAVAAVVAAAGAGVESGMREGLALALATLLAGLLAMLLRRGAFSGLLGLLAAENGALLGLVQAGGGVPAAAALAVLSPGLVACVALALRGRGLSAVAAALPWAPRR